MSGRPALSSRPELIRQTTDASLAGAIDEHTTFDSADNRNALPRFTVDARKANRALVERLRTIGERRGATPAQLALAWLLEQKTTDR